MKWFCTGMTNGCTAERPPEWRLTECDRRADEAPLRGIRELPAIRFR